MNKEFIKNQIKRDFQSKFPYKSNFEIPELKSITLHISFKEQKFESKKFLLPGAMGLEIISGQKARIHSSKKAVALWRLVKGDHSGLSLVLRKEAMQNFYENLVEVILPSMRPFDGIDINSLDKEGNLSFTVPNLFLFPQLEREYLHFQQGFNIKSSFGENFKQLPVEINLATTSKTKEEGELLFNALRIPFAKS